MRNPPCKITFIFKMRLSKHKLPKGVNKQERTVKHKDSEKKRLRKEAKAAKLNEMQVEVSVIPSTSGKGSQIF